MSGEGIAIKALTEVLDHVVTLRLAVDVDVEAKLLLDADVVIDLLLNELVVLSLGNLTLGEALALLANLLGLGERADSSSGEERKVELLLLLAETDGELRLAAVVLLSDFGLALLDLGVVGAGRRGTGLNGLGVGLELLLDGGRALSDGLGNQGNLNSLLGGEREPVSDLGVELLLRSKRVGSVEERRRGSSDDALLAKLLNGRLNSLNGALEVGLPDVTAVDDTSGEDGLGAKSTDDGLELLRVTDKVNMNSVDVLGDEVEVVDDVTEVSGEDELGDLVAKAGELLVGGLESSLGLGGKVEDEDRLIDLDSLGTSFLELSEVLLVNGQKLVEQVNGVNRLATVGLAEVKEGHRADEDGACLDASLLGLLELGNSLGGVNELEGLVVLEGRLDVVVVGVEPLDHLQGGDVDATLLVTTAHGEVLVDGVETILGVAVRDSTEVLDLVEDLVVESKVVAGDGADASILLNLPVSKAKTLGLNKKVSLRDLATPV